DRAAVSRPVRRPTGGWGVRRGAPWALVGRAGWRGLEGGLVAGDLGVAGGDLGAQAGLGRFELSFRELCVVHRVDGVIPAFGGERCGEPFVEEVDQDVLAQVVKGGSMPWTRAHWSG